MKISPKSEFLALGVRLARKKRDGALRKSNRYKNKEEYLLNVVSPLDDVVEAHKRQFKNSLLVDNTKEEEIEYQEL